MTTTPVKNFMGSVIQVTNKMLDQATTQCVCTDAGYSPDCPQAFMQGGQLLHTIDNETRLKPRRYTGSDDSDNDVLQGKNPYHALDFLESVPGSPRASNHSISTDPKSTDQMVLGRQLPVSPIPEPLVPRAWNQVPDHERMYKTDFDLQTQNRVTLEKFEPLKVDGKGLNEVTIGGYTLDMDKIQVRVAAFVPLPPVTLPRIFADDGLNFAHHFSQGLDVLVGRPFMTEVMSKSIQSESDSKKILPTLKSIIKSGHKDGDQDLHTFVKRVLCATFDTAPESGSSSGRDGLLVAANLYGFPYLEQGMHCTDAHLRMWLHLTYAEYKVKWFNSFKSAGLPSFALEGVQERYESRGPMRVRPTRSDTRFDTEYDPDHKPPRDGAVYRREHRRHRQPDRHTEAKKEESSSLMSRFMGRS